MKPDIDLLLQSIQDHCGYVKESNNEGKITYFGLKINNEPVNIVLRCNGIISRKYILRFSKRSEYNPQEFDISKKDYQRLRRMYYTKFNTLQDKDNDRDLANKRKAIADIENLLKGAQDESNGN